MEETTPPYSTSRFPPSADAAPELYEQQEFWSSRPDPNLTGLDLFGDVVRDVARHNEDSDRFDKGLLGSLTKFESVLTGSFREMRLDATQSGESAVIDSELLQTAQEFRAVTPLPQRVRVVGILDMVRASTQSFALRLEDGQEVRGVLEPGGILEAAPLLNQRVLVLGQAIYRASGRLLRIDAEEITTGEGESSLFSRIPPPRNRRDFTSTLRIPQGPKSGIAAILGQWPGDETDEEIDAWLGEIS